MVMGAWSSCSHTVLANNIYSVPVFFNVAKGVDLGAASPPSPAMEDFLINPEKLGSCLVVFGKSGGAAGCGRLLAMPAQSRLSRGVAQMWLIKRRETSGGC